MDQRQARSAQSALLVVHGTNRAKWWEVEDAGVREALFIRLIINLYDALKLLKDAGARLTFTDDVEGAADIHELVGQVRNAACHIGSGDRMVGGTYAPFNMIIGAHPSAYRFGATVLGNPYPDDVAVYYGARRIYLVRHIRRAAVEGDVQLRQIAEREKFD